MRFLAHRHDSADLCNEIRVLLLFTCQHAAQVARATRDNRLEYLGTAVSAATRLLASVGTGGGLIGEADDVSGTRYSGQSDGRKLSGADGEVGCRRVFPGRHSSSTGGIHRSFFMGGAMSGTKRLNRR